MDCMTRILKLVLLCQIYHFTSGQLEEDRPPIYECNSTVTSPRGYLRSPNFPNSYSANEFCQWRITVDEGRSILLSFSNFDLESTRNCKYDQVIAYNGLSQTHPRLGKFCGGFLPADVRSTSNHMLIIFKSDGSGHRRGFWATFESIQPENAGPNSCGGLMTSRSGSFHSVNFPNSNYPNGQTCTWHIRVPENNRIALRFSKLTLEDSANCHYDHVTIFSGWSNRQETRFHGRFCQISQVTNPLTSDGNELFVTFASDSSGNDVGFSASYTTESGVVSSKFVTPTTETTTTVGKAKVSSSPNICPPTVVLQAESGTILSPGYKTPAGYSPNLRCSWSIETAPETRIALRFVNFQLEGDPQCIFDYVIIYSGSSESGSELARYCGDMGDVTVRSSGNRMFILFVTDSGRNELGFRATYNSESLQQETTSSTNTLATPSSVSCESPLSLSSNSSLACSLSFVAAMKVIRIQRLPSGSLKLKGRVIKILKRIESGETINRGTRFRIFIIDPECHPEFVARKKYIFAGNNVESTRMDITDQDLVERFSKKSQKLWRKNIRKCNRRN